MRILILGLNFYPELTGVGKYTAEMAAYLGKAGHAVRVVSAPPYYPYWRVQRGYSSWRYHYEEWQGIQVYRAPLWVPREPSGMKRLLHLFSFAVSSTPLLLWQMLWHPDLVLCIAPTFFSAPLASLIARLCRAKSWLHIQDFELDAAFNLGLLRGRKWIYPLARFYERSVLKSIDRVSTISQKMQMLCIAKGVEPAHVCLVPNWVDTRIIHPLSVPSPLRAELNLPSETFVALYHGNMGRKQGLEILVEAAHLLASRHEILFVLCGEGPAKKDLVSCASSLSNVRFLELMPAEKLNELLNLADVHLLPQLAHAADLVMPSKLMGMLASGKAIIATADPDTDVGSVVSKTGLIVPPEDGLALSNAILALAEAPEKRSQFGKNGREYVCGHWSADQVLKNFQMQLSNLVDPDPLIVSA